MVNRIPALPVIMLAIFGIWGLLASLVTFDPDFAVDRVNTQFIPVSQWIVQVFNDSPDPASLSVMARAFQLIIGTIEASFGLICLAAVFWRRHRLMLTNLGLGTAASLFGSFLLMMFAMHDKELPWNQYPAIFAWIGVTWIMIFADTAASQRRQGDSPSLDSDWRGVSR